MFTMLKKNTKYIPSRIPEKESNNINKIIENKIKEPNQPNSDYYNDSYKIEKLNCSSNRKSFFVEYLFTYDELLDSGNVTHKAAIELGHYDWEFYVEDDATDEEIKEKVDEICNYYINYKVEEGYEAYTEICYRKKGSRY